MLVYINNLRKLYEGGVKLHKVHTQEWKYNMYKKDLGMLACLDKYVVACCAEGVVARLDNNNKEDLMWNFSLHTSWNSFLREPCVVNL